FQGGALAKNRSFRSGTIYAPQRLRSVAYRRTQAFRDARTLCGVEEANTLLDCAYVRWQTDSQSRCA
ncbi:MAG TPA: hypothetical protein PK752_10400, partial [Accumulibacter sp.]|uniref:hypothetical protein n=1 Tax=Accumulibacter sp. TaxID=2053492 RepID=UPI002CF3F41F